MVKYWLDDCWTILFGDHRLAERRKSHEMLSLCRVFELKICCHLKFLHWTNSCVVQLRAQTDTEGVVELRRWTERVYPIGRINDSSNENVISIQVVNSVTRSLVINLMW